MSKLIVEMEMPRNCDECEVNYDCAFCGITGSAFYGNTQVPNFMPDEQKLPDCPIAGVLPDEHGDLIDRDAYLKLLESYIESKRGVCENKEFIVALQAISKQIKCVKAVIKAERKDDD